MAQGNQRGWKRWRKWPWGKIFQIVGIAVASIAIVGFLFILYFAKTLPSIEQLSSQQISQSTRIYDRTGTILLYQITNGPQRTVVSYDQIPQQLKDATVAIEDQNFYNEPAYDWKAILRAFWADITHGSIVQGGSTITQELARNAFLTQNQTITRKIKELILAVKLNAYYSKDQILDLYLNQVSYGPNIAGVEEASEAYFGEPVNQIDLAQAAVLAALPQAPTLYSPWGSHVSDLLARQKLVLQAMYIQGKITQPQLSAAMAETIVFQPQSQGAIKAPNFVNAVENYLIGKYGEDMVDNGGLKVITTLNWTLQQQAETAVEQGVARNTKLYQAYNGALVAEDPTTGQILAMVGSANYFATSSLPVGCTPSVNCKFDPQFNVATQGLRQPGSSLKPFVYLTAFQEGYSPDSILFDVPTEFSTDPSCPTIPNFNSTVSNTKCFHPQNFEGTFVGPVSMRDALAQSINVPAVEALYLVGEQRAIQNAFNFGFTTLTDPSQYGLSLVLGGGAVHLIDEASAYSVLADDGIKNAQSMVLQVQDSQNNVLESWADQATQVADAQSVNLINDVLSDAAARAPLMGASQNLTVFPGYDVALKTGTSNDYRDAWAMGYTPSLVVAVWAGNNDNSVMVRNGSSILAAVPMWSAFMTQALPEVPNTTFVQPDPVNETNPILAGVPYPDGQAHSDLFYIDKDNPTGPPPADPAADPQFKNWEAAVQTWAANNPSSLAEAQAITPPSLETNSTTTASTTPLGL
jgi:membrane peptidoglycan carboxypeptidase